ncbi:predicted protein [Lichtheimia corymbifera JMRC:FSU:9682]|uniref:Uncharacterized protein n=1 Tax=Lichtheimia corymbifera JMRC:FSU:9682 TaxID=1263082 RepID=A0A068RFD6_9FUNG|nr:predicted protein [Lichtheimia corymbifera JMRC:FSU:9682]
MVESIISMQVINTHAHRGHVNKNVVADFIIPGVSFLRYTFLIAHIVENPGFLLHFYPDFIVVVVIVTSHVILNPNGKPENTVRASKNHIEAMILRSTFDKTITRATYLITTATRSKGYISDGMRQQYPSCNAHHYILRH